MPPPKVVLGTHPSRYMLVVFLTSVCTRSLVEENNEDEKSAHS